ncbi:phosphate metabolism protein-domain-containing protein [Xylaria sp. CBS 124048]|nr:phosphate metabolism protein-domain-containing protein [Xylaria sp. CBS 124048]
MRPKIDTQGQAYTVALQHLLTGVYISELALIGFFSSGTAKGPMMITLLLFVVTVLYHVVTNRYMGPLESVLPAELVSPAERSDETTPLLGDGERGKVSSDHRQGPSAYEPGRMLELMTRFFGLHVFSSSSYMKLGVRVRVRDVDGQDTGEQDIPEYAEEDLQCAYLHPALTSRTPVVWMARDGMGASQNEVRDTEECGLRASDEGAWLDKKRSVQVSVMDFEKVPVWRPVVSY